MLSSNPTRSPVPLVANQLQLSMTHAPIIAQPLAMNMMGEDQSIARDGGGIVDYCRINNIAIQAWSPFQPASSMACSSATRSMQNSMP